MRFLNSLLPTMRPDMRMREPWPEHEPISKSNQYGRDEGVDLSGESTLYIDNESLDTKYIDN